MPVLYDKVTRCLGSLTFSLVSATSTNDIPVNDIPCMAHEKINQSLTNINRCLTDIFKI